MATEEAIRNAGILRDAIIAAESGGNPNAVSNKGAGGLMQLMPETATRFGVRDRFDPAQNIAGGTAYLAWLWDRFGGKVDHVLAGYNAGEGAVEKHGGVPPFAETRAYVDKVRGHLTPKQVMMLEHRQVEEGPSAGPPPASADPFAGPPPGADPFAGPPPRLDTVETTFISMEAPPQGTGVPGAVKPNTPLDKAGQALPQDYPTLKAQVDAGQIAQGGSTAIGHEQSRIGLQMLLPTLQKALIEGAYGKKKELPAVPSWNMTEEQRGQRIAQIKAEQASQEKLLNTPFDMPLPGADAEVKQHYQRVNDELLDLARRDEALAQELQKSPIGTNIGAGVVQNAPRMVGPIAAGMAFGGATPTGIAAAAITGALLNSDIATRTYTEARKKGLAPEAARGLAIKEHAAEIIPDALLFGRILKGGGSAIKSIATAMGLGGPEEISSDLMQAGLESAAYREPFSYPPEQALVTGAVGTVLSGAGAGGAEAMRPVPGMLQNKQSDLFLETPGQESWWSLRQKARDKLQAETVAQPVQAKAPENQMDMFSPATWGNNESLFPMTAMEMQLAKLTDEELLALSLQEVQITEQAQPEEEVQPIEEAALVEEAAPSEEVAPPPVPSAVDFALESHEETLAEIEKSSQPDLFGEQLLSEIIQAVPQNPSQTPAEQAQDIQDVLRVIGATDTLTVQTQVQEAIDNGKVFTPVTLEGLEKNLMAHPEFWDEQGQTLIIPTTGNVNGISWGVWKAATDALSALFPQGSAVYSALHKWWGPAQPEGINGPGEAVFEKKTPEYVKYYEAVQAQLEQLFPGKDRVIVFYGHGSHELAWHVKVKNSKPTYDQKYGNGSFRLDKAKSFASGAVTVLSVPKKNIYALGQHHLGEQEVFYKFAGAFPLGQVPISAFSTGADTIPVETLIGHMDPTAPGFQKGLPGIPPAGMGTGEIKEEERAARITLDTSRLLDILTLAGAEFQDLVNKTAAYAKIIGGKLGSQPASVQQLPSGQKVYAKQSPLGQKVRAWHELLANKIYEAMNLPAPIMAARMGSGKDGKITLYTIWEEVKEPTLTKAIFTGLSPLARKTIWHGFAADAWLGNTDVVGHHGNNMVILQNGMPMRIDSGGALGFYGNGEAKEFGAEVKELEQLKDPHSGHKYNGSAKWLWGEMPAEEELFSAKLVANLPDQLVEALVEETGLKLKIPIKTRKAMTKTLIQRKNYVEQYYKTWALPGVAPEAKEKGAAVALASMGQTPLVAKGIAVPVLEKSYWLTQLLEKLPQLAKDHYYNEWHLKGTPILYDELAQKYADYKAGKVGYVTSLEEESLIFGFDYSPVPPSYKAAPVASGGTLYSFPGPIFTAPAQIIGKFWKRSQPQKVIQVGGVNAQAAALLRKLGVYSSNEERELSLSMDRFHARSKLMFWLNKKGLNRVGQGEVGMPLNTTTILDWNWHIPGIPEYAHALDRLHIMHMQELYKWDDLVTRLNQFGDEKVQQIGDYLDAIASLEYLPAGAQVRQPTPQEKKLLAQKYGIAGKVMANGQVAPTAAEQIADEIMGQYANALEQVREVWKADARRLYKGPDQEPALQARLAEIDTEINAMLNVPYSPSYRDGEWGLTIKDATGAPVDFSAYGNKRDALRTAAKLKASKYYAAGFTFTVGIIPQEFRRYAGLPRHVLQNMQGKLNLTPAQEDIFSAILMNSLPHKAYIHRFRPKRRMPGYTKDVMMQLARYGQAHSNYISKATYGWQMAAALGVMKKSLRDLDKISLKTGEAVVPDKRHRIILNLTALHDEIMNPRDNYNGLKGFIGFFWYLSDLSRAVLEPLIVPMVSWRNLSSVFGPLGLTVAGQLATEDAAMTFNWKHPGKIRPQTTARGQAKEKAIALAESQNLLGEAFAIQIAGFAEGNNMDSLLAGAPWAKAWRKLLWASSTPMREGEKAARRLTFNTTWELTMKALGQAEDKPAAKPFNDWITWVKDRHAGEIKDLVQEGWLPNEAVAYAAAKEMIWKSAGEYAGWNKPRSLTSSSMMDLAFTALNYYFQHWRRITSYSHKPYRTATYDNKGDLVVREYRNPMQKAAFDNLIIHLVLVGAMGMPFASWLVDLLDSLLFGLKKSGHTSLELGDTTIDLPSQSVKGMVRSYLGSLDPDLPDFALHGLGYHTFGLYTMMNRMGYGDYFPDLDFSSPLAMGAPFPVDLGRTVKSFVTDQGADGGDLADDILAESFGLGYTQLHNFAKSLINDSPIGLGDFWKHPGMWAHERGGVVPKSVRSALAAVGAATTGVEQVAPNRVMALGGKPVEWDMSRPADAAETVFRGIGLSPTRLRQVYEERDEQKQAGLYWITRKRVLLQERNTAMHLGNDLEEYQQGKASYNASVPFPSLKITPEEEQASWKSSLGALVDSMQGIAVQGAGEAKLPLMYRSLLESGHLQGVKTERLKEPKKE